MDLSMVGQDVALCCSHPLSLKEVLQLRLQNRKHLGERANMPSMKDIPNFIETRTCLQHINADDPLKHKMRTFSHPSDLVPLDIFAEETPVSVETRQKRARLANDLSDKILHRPGPLELLEKNILPLHPPVDIPQGVIEMGASVGLSQLDTQLHGSVDLSARQNGVHTTPGCATSTEGGTSAPESGQGPGKHALHITPAITSRSRPFRKFKDVKPKVRKLKYHQYIPPEQRGAAINSPALDVEYSRLLQQQQLYLQLQIIGQQQQSLALPATSHPSRGLHTEPLLGFTATLPTFLPTLPLAPTPRSLSAATPTSCQKPELLPPKLEDLTVSELRQQLRKRGLPVSGTKPALLERLKPFRAPPPQLGTPPPNLPTPSPLPKERVVERLAQKLRLDALPVPLPPSPHPLIPPSPPGTCFSSDSIDDSKPPVCLSLSPATLHSLFPMDDMEFESRSDSGSQERFGNEIFLGSDSRESIPPSRRSGIETLEEELTEAIRSAELSDSTSIEDILDEPFISNGSSSDVSDGLSPPSLSPSSGLSPSPLSSTPSPTYPCLPAPPPPPLDLLAPSPPSAEISLDPCDWADRVGGYGHSSTFTVDFLDAPDLNINRMIDLLVEQW